MGLQRVSNDWATFTFTILKLGNFTLEIWISGFPDSSAGKESACNAGDPCSIPGSRRSPGEGIGYLLQYSWASGGSAGKASVCSVGDLGSICGLGRALGEGNGYPLRYSGLENSMHCTV